MSKYTPRAYQVISVDHAIANPRAGLFARPGMGKTSSTLSALDSLYLAGFSTPTLILAPKRVARYTWPKEVQKWDDFRHLDVSPVVGTEKQRVAALARDVPIYTTNYEQIPWLVDHFGSRWPFGIIVADESTKLKNLRVSVRPKKDGSTFIQNEGGSNRAMLLSKIAFHKNVKRFIELTGSPAANGYKDLWGQVFFLDRGYRLGSNYGAFEARWFERVMKHRNDKFGELRLRHGAQEEINRLIADLCLALDPRDWFPDLEEPLRYTVNVDLPPKARDLYRKMEREMYIEIAGKGIEAFTAGVAMGKCRQLASGAIIPEVGEKWLEVHDEKLQALESIHAECGGMPILVAYMYKSDLARILATFKDRAADLSTDKGLKAFMAGEVDFGCGQPASIGHGFDGMQDVTNVIAFFSSDFNLEYREQIIERIGPVRQLQSGHKRKVLIYDIVAEDTIDEHLITVLDTKCSVQEAVFAAMKRKNIAL